MCIFETKYIIYALDFCIAYAMYNVLTNKIHRRLMTFITGFCNLKTNIMVLHVVLLEFSLE